MIEKLDYDFFEAFQSGDKEKLYDGIIEIYGKLNEVIDAVNQIESVLSEVPPSVIHAFEPIPSI